MRDLILKKTKALATDERAATAIEYGLIVGLVAIAAIIAMTALGDSVMTLWNYVDSNVDAVINSSP